MRPRHLMLGVALVGAAVLAAFGDTGPKQIVVQPTNQSLSSARPARQRAEASARVAGPAIARLMSRDMLTGPDVNELDPASNKLFATLDWTPPPPPPAVAPAPPPPPPPSAPPLPFTFLGKAIEEGRWEVYLARGNMTYIAREKTVIEETDRVDSISPPILTLTYLPLKQTQRLPIGGFD